MEMMLLTPNKLEHELEFRRRFSYWGDVDISGSLIFAGWHMLHSVKVSYYY